MKPSYSFNPRPKGKPNLIIQGRLNGEILKAVEDAVEILLNVATSLMKLVRGVGYTI